MSPQSSECEETLTYSSISLTFNSKDVQKSFSLFRANMNRSFMTVVSFCVYCVVTIILTICFSLHPIFNPEIYPWHTIIPSYFALVNLLQHIYLLYKVGNVSTRFCDIYVHCFLFNTCAFYVSRTIVGKCSPEALSNTMLSTYCNPSLPDLSINHAGALVFYAMFFHHYLPGTVNQSFYLSQRYF